MSIQDFPKVPTPSVNNPNAQFIEALYHAFLNTIQANYILFKSITKNNPSIDHNTQDQIGSQIQALNQIGVTLQQAYLDYQSSANPSEIDSLRKELPDLFK